MIMSLRVDQVHGRGLLSDSYSIPERKHCRTLSVAGEVREWILTGIQVDLDLACGVHDERTAAQCVGTDGHQHDGIEIRMQYRSAPGERVGSGTGRGGYDQSVGALVVHQASIHVGFELEQASELCLVSSHFIQCVQFRHHFAVSFHLGLEQQALLFIESAVEDLAQSRDQLVGHDVGKEAETAQVDTEQGDLMLHQRSCGTKKSAVSSDHDHEIASAPEFLPSVYRLSSSRQVSGTALVEHQAPLA